MIRYVHGSQTAVITREDMAAINAELTRLRTNVVTLRDAIAKHRKRTHDTHGPGSGSAPDRELWGVLDDGEVKP
jgi:hypothetical protein